MHSQLSIKLPRKAIPAATMKKLWVLAAGRCQYDGCNCELFIDDLTQRGINKGYTAHIIAASPGGPRGDFTESPRLEVEISNLMLLCNQCHIRIDTADVDNHPAELLRKMKSDHEKRIKFVTGIQAINKSVVVAYLCKIGDFFPVLSKEKAFATIMTSYFPLKDYVIEGGTRNSPLTDNEDDYWHTEQVVLTRWYEREVKPHLNELRNPHISVFALAPQPLLIMLGSLISELYPATIYQYFRSPSDSWLWQEDETESGIKLIAPEDFTGTPVLLLSLSAPVNHERITGVFKTEKISIWEVTVENPGRDPVKTQYQLDQIKKIFQKTYDQIRFNHPKHDLIHVFPVMPNSAAVEFGRMRNPKADLPIRIYDQNNKSKAFIPTIIIR